MQGAVIAVVFLAFGLANALVGLMEALQKVDTALGKATKHAVGSTGPSDVETGIESMATFLYVSLLLF